MCRAGLILAVFVGLAAWVGAQGPAPLAAADRVQLLRVNRTLLAELVDRGIELGAADHAVSRAEACRGTARALGVAVQRAAEGQDANRVAELSDHLELMVRDGLVPVLDEAIRVTPPESPDAARLQAIRKDAADDLKSFRSVIPAARLSADNPLGKDGAGKLDALIEQLKK